MKQVIFLIFIISKSVLFSQNILINDVGGTPEASAALEIRATDKGMLVPRMLEGNRLAISSPAQGLLVFQTNSLVGFYYYNGTAWDTLGGSSVVNNISNVTNSSNSNIAVLQDIKGLFHGGTFTAGGWRDRTLNTHSGDSSFLLLDAGNIEFTLDSGIYVLNAYAPGYKVGQHQVRLFNITSNAPVAFGHVSTSANSLTTSNMTTIVTVTSASNTFKIQHYSSSSQNSDGFGVGVAWGTNVYTQVWIQKL